MTGTHTYNHNGYTYTYTWNRPTGIDFKADCSGTLGIAGTCTLPTDVTHASKDITLANKINLLFEMDQSDCSETDYYYPKLVEING